jgi:large subunit ribosomal protein L31e
MADEFRAKEAKFVALQEKKSEEAKEKKQEVELAAIESKEKKVEGKKGAIAPKAQAKKEGEKAATAKAPEKKEEKKEEKEIKKREIILERIYSIPLDVYAKPQQHRANAAIKVLKKFLARHMKTDIKKVKIALIVNNTIRKRGGGRPMKKVKVKATKDKEGIVLAELAA